MLFRSFNLTFFPMHFLGLTGMPRRTYRYTPGLGWDNLNLLVTAGGFIIALATLLFITNAVWSWKRGPIAEADPWDGRTLEWSIPSPTPEYNFARIPQVTARDDFWHRKYTEDDQGRLVRLPAGGSGEDSEVDVSSIHLPSPSYFPLILSLGLPVIGYAAVYKNPWLAVPGVLLLLFGMYGWAIEPGTAED